MTPFTKILNKWLQRPGSGTTPLDNLRRTRRWIDQLHALHEYDAHQLLVDTLNQYNQSNAPLDDQRLRILDALEHAGTRLQRSLIAQYLKNQSIFRYAGKSLWQEIFAYYWQLALAYQSLVKAATHDHPGLATELPAITLHALHYQGKLIQWRYMRYESPAPNAWRNIHALYSIAEFNGFAATSLALQKNTRYSCAEAYMRILLLNLVNPVGLTPWKIELAALWMRKWSKAMQPAAQFDPHSHTH